MKNSLRLASGLALSLVLAATALLALGPSPDAAVAAGAAPRPQVQGNRLVDTTTGATFVPHGVNIPGLEYSCVQGWRKLPAAGELTAIASWKINTVRLPLNESCWLGLDGAPSGRTAAQYRADVRSWVDGATAAGLAVILDLHWNAPAGYTASGQRAMPDERSGAFWTSVATDYASTPSVMFELFNEPYSRSGFTLTWACWKNGGCQAPVENDETGTLSGATYTVTGMQSLVTAVRATGASQPILLGGLNYSNDLTGWIANKPTDPLNQLVAAWHNYPGQGCSTSCWDTTITTVAASVPIVTTEFGNTAETTSTAPGSGNYLVPFMTWADAHGIGYMPWAWWDVTGGGNGVYALYSGASFTPKAPSGTKFHAYLASLTPQPPTTAQRFTRDFTSDSFNDVPARTSSGAFLLFGGNGASGWSPTVVMGTGWNIYGRLLSPGDFSGDGLTDTMVTDSAGRLILYRGNGHAGWLGAEVVGTGWNTFTAIVGVGDFDEDGKADIMTRDAGGALVLWSGNGASGWARAAQIGSGWNIMNTILSAGDFDGDTHSDVIARDVSGRLWLYPGNGRGGWLPTRQIGSGWNMYSALVSNGDFSGDGKADVIARDTAGGLWLWAGDGTGGWLTATQVGSGWNGYTFGL